MYIAASPDEQVFVGGCAQIDSTVRQNHATFASVQSPCGVQQRNNTRVAIICRHRAAERSHRDRDRIFLTVNRGV